MISLRRHIIRLALSMRRTNQLFVAAVVLLGIFVVVRVRRGDVGPWMAVLSLVWLASVTWLAAGALAHGLRWSRSTKVNIRLFVGVTFASLLCLEALLRVSVPRLATYPEVNGLPYRSQYQRPLHALHAYRPGQQILERKPEFVHRRTASSLGLTDREIALEKAPDEYRILALGDSFTEGVGAPEDATWVRVMQREVQARYPKRRITTINAGVSGSDPFAEYAVLKERLLPLQPNLVIVATNSSDMAEMLVRGGRERFQSDGTVQYRAAPFWEPLYAVSYIARLVARSGLGYNFYLIRNSRMQEEMEIAAGKIGTAVEDFQRLCAEHRMEFLLVVHPTRFEVYRGSYDKPYAELMGRLAARPGFRFADLLQDFSRDKTITPENVAEFYWALDLHHNARGYEVMGRAIARRIAEARLVDPQGDAPQ